MTQKQITGLWFTSRFRAAPLRMSVWIGSVVGAAFSWLMFASHGYLFPVLFCVGLALMVSVLALADLQNFRERLTEHFSRPPAPSRLIHPDQRQSIRAGIGDSVRQGL